MKNTLTIVSVALIAFASPGYALNISNSDAWQYSNISAISSPTVHEYSDALNMFGHTSFYTDPNTALNKEASNTLFNDSSAQGFWHTVEWTLNSPVTLGSFNLVAEHDDTNFNPNDLNSNGYRDQNYRGFNAITLEYKNSANNWQPLYSLSNIGTAVVLGDNSTHPVYGGDVNYPALNVFELYVNVVPTTADTWRVSFEQYGPANGNSSGPRILELDGNMVPEPDALLLFGAGLVGVVGFRRKKR